MDKHDAAKSTRHQQIQFVLDGELIQPKDVAPTRTLLDYLREDLRRTGSKEGCAEGDCGACTVVIGELHNNKLQLHTANACIQCLPTLDGKQLFTVESLSDEAGNLHPVQQALVDSHASQCGFCTPGFVMSLFWLYKNQTKTNLDELRRVLSGNICRCTGYRPILEAGVNMYDPALLESTQENASWMHTPGSSRSPDAQALNMLKAMDLDSSLELIHTESDSPGYLAPTELSELATIYKSNPEATLLAGGTDIGIWITKMFKSFSLLIYTGKVQALTKITTTAEHIEIGSAVTITQVMPVLLKSFPELDDLFNRFASLPIRNLATLGGNICNASPIGDSMPILLCLDTQLKLRNGDSCRSIPLKDFYLDYQKTALQPGEFLESICIPLRPANTQVASYKVSKRFDQDISAVCAAFCLSEQIKIAYGGVAAIPIRAYKTEEFLNSRPLSEDTIAAAVAMIREEFQPLSDMRASADYRREVTGNLLQRFLYAVLEKNSDSTAMGIRDYTYEA